MLSITNVHDLTLKHLDEILDIAEKFREEENILQHESRLRELEKIIVADNIDTIIAVSKDTGLSLIKNSTTAGMLSLHEACIYRYVHVPILYQLGLTERASQLGQSTFEYLFPLLHQKIFKKLSELFYCTDFSVLQKSTMKIFSCDDPKILGMYGRVKSTNSIWKKIESVASFTKMNIQHFSEIIDDFIALRWNMRIEAGENRYDALLNAIPLIPKNNVLSFRNQQVAQKNGFSAEPVMKFYYRIDGVPVELQLLGGLIEGYLCAKGYSAYKIGCQLRSLQLSPEEECARLGSAIYFFENNLHWYFYHMILQELISGKFFYDHHNSFTLDTHPIGIQNLSMKFTEDSRPIFEISNFRFPENLLLLKVPENYTSKIKAIK